MAIILSSAPAHLRRKVDGHSMVSTMFSSLSHHIRDSSHRPISCRKNQCHKGREMKKKAMLFRNQM
ncbi:hypothetical protein QJS04_geneDACA008933 [Acorus gramineus]|uniref:Uncharacterized protein n=1 Tax=Acorus gramineus TaxID=55184 RepID=A0AAV9ABT1_ACOGR|nr:hypothetical protein QJS04_geneDACA008933 [Acorus gramineus]